VLFRVADYAADYAAIRGIRFAVFVDEQRVPPELEMDDRDAVCSHFLGYDGATAIATGRIDLDYDGKVGRVAVLPSHRRAGAGTQLMAEIHALARRRGLASVWCNAQIVAAPFYERLGYRVASEPFDEAGIAHVRMTLDLRTPR
jgi:predicted GNAT family N-acyltransferase